MLQFGTNLKPRQWYMHKKLALYYMCHISLISKLKGNPQKTFDYMVMINRHLEDADGCKKIFIVLHNKICTEKGFQ